MEVLADRLRDANVHIRRDAVTLHWGYGDATRETWEIPCPRCVGWITVEICRTDTLDQVHSTFGSHFCDVCGACGLSVLDQVSAEIGA